MAERGRLEGFVKVLCLSLVKPSSSLRVNSTKRLLFLSIEQKSDY